MGDSVGRLGGVLSRMAESGENKNKHRAEVSSDGGGTWNVNVGGQNHTVDAQRPRLQLDADTAFTFNPADGSLTVEEGGQTYRLPPPQDAPAASPSTTTTTTTVAPAAEPEPVAYAIAVQLAPEPAAAPGGTVPIDGVSGFRSPPSAAPSVAAPEEIAAPLADEASGPSDTVPIDGANPWERVVAAMFQRAVDAGDGSEGDDSSDGAAPTPTVPIDS